MSNNLGQPQPTASMAMGADRMHRSIRSASFRVMTTSDSNVAPWIRPDARISGASEMAPYPSGKGEVCKTSMPRFESGWRLQLSLWSHVGKRMTSCHRSVGMWVGTAKGR